jgi:hypothetical protein
VPTVFPVSSEVADVDATAIAGKEGNREPGPQVDDRVDQLTRWL